MDFFISPPIFELFPNMMILMKGGNIVITTHYTDWMLLFTSFMLDFIDSLSVCFDRFSEDYSQTLNTIHSITMNHNSSESLATERRGCGANKNNYKIVCLLYYIHLVSSI